MNERGTLSDWLIFLALGFMWGSAYLFIKIGVETLTPFTLIAARLAIGTVVLATAVALARDPLPRDVRTYAHLVVMAVIGIVIPFFLITSAERTTDSALAAIINGATPLFVMVIAALALRDEPITVNRVVGLAVGFVGVIVLVSRGLGAAEAGGSLYGPIALVGSTISYAAAPVYVRRNLQGVNPRIGALFEIGFAFVIATILALVLERPFDTVVRPEAVVSVVWLGALGSGLAFVAFFHLVGRWGPTRTALVAYLLPVVGIVLGAVVLNEAVDIRIVAGALLVIGGVALVNGQAGLRRLRGSRPADVPGVIEPE